MYNRAHRIALDDLTRTLSKNEELERLVRLKDDFLANTTHELRTPLHGIVGIAESLFSDLTVKSSPFLQSNLLLIVTSARRLSNLVNDILDFSKMRNNDLVIAPRPLDPVQIIRSVLPNFSVAAEGKGISIELNITEDVPPVFADEDRLIQILFNLIGNAV